MIKVGITGGIGSGKTTVCRYWQEMGAYVLYADELAKQVMARDKAVREELKEAFGNATFSDDGSLNREHLAEEAFQKGRVDTLNAIVHPRLPVASQQVMEQAADRGYEVFVYEAALLLENLEPGRLDYLVLVLADEAHRVQRVRERDQRTVIEIKARIDKQQSYEEVVNEVDFIICNNGTLEELRQKATKLYEKFLL